MAVLNCYEIHENRGGSVTYPEDGITVKEYKRVFTVITSVPTDNSTVVLTAPCLPFFYEPLAGDTDCLCKAIVPTPIADYFCAWRVECTYDNKPYLPAYTPLCKPPEWSFSFQRSKEPVELDVAGNNVWNSARMPMTLEREVSLPIVTVKWASINFDYTDLYNYADAVNSDMWYGFQPGVLKVEGFTVSQQYDPLRAGRGQGSPPGLYYEKQLSLALRWDGWQASILDAGQYQLPEKPPPVGQPPHWEPCIDTHGQPVQQPVPLKNGRQLPFGQTPVYLNFEIYRTIEFASIIDWPSLSPGDCPEQ